MLSKNSNSSYTNSVALLVNAINGNTAEQPSLYQQATEYFKKAPLWQQKLEEFDQKIAQVKEQSSETDKTRIAQQIAILEAGKAREFDKQEEERLQRLRAAIVICLDILSISEGDDFAETQHKSAKFLSSVLLISPGEGKQLAELHQSLKPAYKAVLSLRLLDKLISTNLVKNKYILQHFNPAKRYEAEDGSYVCFTQSVLLPVLLAAVFQDVGMQHPEVIQMMHGLNGEKDPYRLLEPAERDHLLKLSYHYTIEYLQFGLGAQAYIGNSAKEKAEFDEAEVQRLRFQISLVKDANQTSLGTSEIIKIPQIYASIVFSTKRNYERKSISTAALVIEQLAVKEMISPQLAQAFVSIVGHFPLGYGITYIPLDLRGVEQENYEYAIVIGLNPAKPQEPMCRLVSKDQMFLTQGVRGVIPKERNLHYPVARKKLVKIEPKRLAEIMQKLSYAFDPSQIEDLIPYCWEPYDYFFVQGNQNL